MSNVDDGEPDSFVEDLLNALCKPTFVWRMARAMIGPGASPAQLASATTRMRNAEKNIRDIAFTAVEVERKKVGP